METNASNSQRQTLEHAWRYFALHASQRMAMFNYFIVLFGLVSAGLAGCLRETGPLRLCGAVLGVALSVTAYTFWKLDQRTAFLIKHAEGILRRAERDLLPDEARLFDSEPEKTHAHQAMKSPGSRIWTYRQSFSLIFALAGLVGVGGAIVSIVLHYTSKSGS